MTHRRDRRRQPGRPAAGRRGVARVPHPAHRVRAAGARHRGDARRRRLRRAGAARQRGRLDDPVRLLRRPGPARDPALAAGRRAARQADRLPLGLAAPRRRGPGHPAHRAGRCRRHRRQRRGGGRRLRGLPDVPARDAARRRRRRHRPHRREPRRHLHRGVDRRGDPRPRPRPAPVRRGARPRRLRLVDRRRPPPSPTSAHTAIALGFTIVPAALIAVSLLVLRGYRLDQEVPR